MFPLQALSSNVAQLDQTTPHMSTHNLSQHVHRIGYHFPSTVVAAACSELGLYLTSAGKAVPFHTLGALQANPPANSEVDQVTINTEARDAIRDLFPNIPDNDINQIIKTAFQKVSPLRMLMERTREKDRRYLISMSTMSGSTKSRHSIRVASGPQSPAGSGSTHSPPLH
jgi:hypothetical protein